MSKYNVSWKTFFVLCVSLMMISSIAWAGKNGQNKEEKELLKTKHKHHEQYTEIFTPSDCTFSTTGSNTYMSLEPGTEILLEGEEDGELVQVRITATDTEALVDGVLTRQVFEEEWIDGELIEESWNWFARCIETSDIYYFGEDVNIYEDEETTHDGAWKAGIDGAIAGIFMPGSFLLGAQYYQEIAPDVAMDRAEHIAMGLTVETPADTYTDCIKILETTPLEKKAQDIKLYAPGEGLIQDGTIKRVSEFEEVE